MSEKSWAEMTPAERSAFMAERKAAKRAEREAAAGGKVVAGLREAIEHAKASRPDPEMEDDPSDDESDEVVREIGDSEDEAEPGAIDVMAERRARLLQGISPDVAALISDDELEEIEREERAAAEATRKERALKDVRAAMRQSARIENDLISAETLRTAAEKKRLAEPVQFRVNIPGDGGGAHALGFRVDGVLYQQGFVYTRPRAVFDSLREMHYRAHLNETRFSTLNQENAGRSAIEMLQRTLPPFEVINGAA